MEPLSKSVIDSLDNELHQLFGAGIDPLWSRLFYTARLGAEFVKQTQTAQEDK